MKTALLLPMCLAIALSACGTTPASPSPVSVTRLDVAVDLTAGNQATPGWKPAGETLSLVSQNAIGTAGNLLTQTTLGPTGQAHLTLPTDAQIAGFLQTISTDDLRDVPTDCAVKSFEASPATFKSVSTSAVLSTSTNSTGYLSLGDLNPASDTSFVGESTFRALVYVDQPVHQHSVVDCVTATRQDHNTITLDLPQGWSVLRFHVVRSGTGTSRVYTTSMTNEPSTSGTATLNLIGVDESSAPRR